MVTMPDEVPVFDATMIHKGYSHGPDETRCSVVWLLNAFGSEPSGRVPYCDLLTTVANQNSAREYHNPPSWNDDPAVSKADIATCLNRTTALAGYVVGNPEARWAAAQKRNAKRWRVYQEALRREEEMRETARVQAAERAEATRQQALAKLTAAEREALGLSPSPSSKGDA